MAADSSHLSCGDIMRAVLLISVIVLSQITSVPAATIIHAGRLIDGQSDEPRTEMSIVIKDNKIAKVVAGFVEPGENDTLIRLTDHTVMPGLMDMHTHLMSQFSKDAYT